MVILLSQNPGAWPFCSKSSCGFSLKCTVLPVSCKALQGPSLLFLLWPGPWPFSSSLALLQHLALISLWFCQCTKLSPSSEPVYLVPLPVTVSQDFQISSHLLRFLLRSHIIREAFWGDRLSCERKTTPASLPLSVLSIFMAVIYTTNYLWKCFVSVSLVELSTLKCHQAFIYIIHSRCSLKNFASINSVNTHNNPWHRE